MTARPVVQIEPDVGVPDLIRRLSDDSKRLATDEVRLAKLEMRESVKTASKGTLWFAVAFGAGVVAAVALTVALIALIGRIANGNYWLGALVVGLVEGGAAWLLVKRGLATLAEPSYSLEESREALKDTASWIGGKGRAD